MRTRQTALRMIVLSFLLVGCMCIFAACAKSEKKASAAGVYHLYSMESDGDSYSHDDIVSYGLDSMTLTLYADGTASLGFGEVPGLRSRPCAGRDLAEKGQQQLVHPEPVPALCRFRQCRERRRVPALQAGPPRRPDRKSVV